MRAFIGIDFPQDAKKQAAEIQKIVRSRSVSGRWKYIDNFHLTLKFLGEIHDEQVNEIYESLKIGFENEKIFSIRTGGLGYFNGIDCMRVVFMELVDKEECISRAFTTVEECCSRLGFPMERRKYTPHITIAQDVVLSEEFSCVKAKIQHLPCLEIPVKKIDIIKSEQIRCKRIYTSIRSIYLK